MNYDLMKTRLNIVTNIFIGGFIENQIFGGQRSLKESDIKYFFILKIKVYNNEITDDTTYELLYDTTNTVPGGAIYHDYPLALKINLRNTTHTTTTK